MESRTIFISLAIICIHLFILPPVATVAAKLVRVRILGSTFTAKHGILFTVRLCCFSKIAICADMLRNVFSEGYYRTKNVQENLIVHKMRNACAPNLPFAMNVPTKTDTPTDLQHIKNTSALPERNPEGGTLVPSGSSWFWQEHPFVCVSRKPIHKLFL